jgi:protein-disulfide isomerase
VQLSNLKAQQDDMLKMLSQLTDLAQGKKAAAPDPTPAAPAITTLSTAGLPVEGPSNAKVVMVEFTDFECTYCGQYAREIYPQIDANYIRFGKIQYFYHPMPLNIHPHAVQAAEAAQCAADQGKFWEMHDSLFANQSALEEKDFLGRAQALGLDVQKFSQCMLVDKYSDGLRNGEADWESRGVKGTPTFFIGILQPDGTVKVDYTINGAMSYETYQKDLDAELAKS